MEKHIFLRIAFSIVLKDLLTAGVYAHSCPSPPVTYASEGDNVTMCWRLLPVARSVFLRRFSVMALKRPVEAAMEKVASVNGQTGDFERFYASKHDGLYVDQVDGDADLQSLVLFLRFTNFTSEMQNIYCIKYEMSGKDDINTCYSQALILRDIGYQVPRSTQEHTNAPTAEGVGRRVASCNQNTISTILGCFLGVISAVISVLAIVVFVLFFHERKRSIALNYRQGDVQ